jgi:crotonobetainyl-CoA:carnitine CoA-transferase CaiB-like acyl-CoA transferase
MRISAMPARCEPRVDLGAPPRHDGDVIREDRRMATAFDEVMDVRAVFSGRQPPEAGEVTMTGADPVFSTRFKIGETCAAVLGGVGVAVSDLWEMKTGRRQKVSIDVRHAAAGLRSSVYLQRPGADGTFVPVVNKNHEAMISITQPWQTKDGRWVLTHFGLPNLQARMQTLLGCELNPQSVASAVSKWDALDLEAAIDEARVCGGVVRSSAEWLGSHHGQVLAAKPIVEIIKIGDSDPEPLPKGGRPLSGIRALDLTRILAGPMAARTLAEHGADVLMVTAERLPQIPEHVIDTNHGKRSCFLDLAQPEDAARMRALVRGADVFSQGYRPGMIAKLGFGPDEVAALRPGIVYASINCYGADGPFSHRGGWEQVAQTMTGLCHEGRTATRPDGPALLPAAACDYTTGYLAAYGILLALAKRARDGGSYHVRVSLCQSGMFVYRQGRIAFPGLGLDLSAAELDAIRIESRPKSGPLRHLGPILKFSETTPHWTRPTPQLGGDAPEWLEAAPRAAAAE